MTPQLWLAFFLLLLLCSSMSMEDRLNSGASEARQPSPVKEAAELGWNKLMDVNPSSLQGWKKSQLEELFGTLVQVGGVPPQLWAELEGVRSEECPMCWLHFCPRTGLFLQAELWDVKDVAADKIQHVFRIFQALLKVVFLIIFNSDYKLVIIGWLFCYGCRQFSPFSPQNWHDELQAAFHFVASGKTDEVVGNVPQGATFSDL